MNEQREKIEEEILKDAEKKAKRTLRRARKDADKLLDQVHREHASRREERLAEARRQGEERARAVLAGIRQEIRRRRLRCEEAVLDEVFRRALERLRGAEDVDTEASLRALLNEAVRGVNDTALRVHLSPADLKTVGEERVTKWVAAVIGRSPETERSVEVTPDEAVCGGVIVESGDGRRRYINTYEDRLRRMKDRLRSMVRKALTDEVEASDNVASREHESHG